MFKFFLGLTLMFIAGLLAVTGIGIVLALPLGVIGIFLVVYSLIAGMGKAVVAGAKAGAKVATKNSE